MKTSTTEQHQLGLAYLYDPIVLTDVRLDNVKEDFPNVDSDAECVFLESPPKKLQVQVFSARLDYQDENVTIGVSARDLASLKTLLKAMPQVKIKALGVTIFSRSTLSNDADAGLYVVRNLFLQPGELENKLGAKLLAGSQRFAYGEEERFFDLRITPDQIGGKLLHMHFHRFEHKSLTDRDRIFEETVTAQEDALREFARVIELL
jgi:hypothetical protein